MKTILKPGRNCLGLYEVAESGLLIDSRAYFRAFFHAAGGARNYILLSGWQFDSDVRLVRGKDADQEEIPTGLLAYLNYLCGKNPNLEIYILAWDFSFIFTLDREWFLKWKFHWNSGGRIRFLFDNVHAVGASHHEKFAVIDGRVGFVGGIDFSAGHWDDCDHLADNPDRVDLDGNPYEACHDLQAFFTGPAVRELVGYFLNRWSLAGGDKPILPPPDSMRRDFNPSHFLPASRIALSRTAAGINLSKRDAVREIRRLFLDAVAAAVSLIYIENQFFGSQAFYKALLSRMRRRGASKLQIVILLPRNMHTFYEEVLLGVTQMRMLSSLRDVAQETGHSLGIYWTAADGAESEEEQTYIHSKLLLVDDRFLSVGSANTTNRSMILDSELNISWEAGRKGEDKLAGAIRRVRVRLLAEHAGLRRPVEWRGLYRHEGLVAYLDRLSESSNCRLGRYNPEYALGKSGRLRKQAGENFSVDPEKPIIKENVFEHSADNMTALFTRGILLLHEWLRARGRND